VFLRTLRALNQLDVYVKEDFDGACSDTEGRMGAGGSMALVHYHANQIGLSDLSWGGTADPGTVVNCGGDFSLTHGAIGNGRGGVEARRVNADHYNIGNVRAECMSFEGQTWAAGWRTLQGRQGGRETCGALYFPHGPFSAAVDEVSRALDAAFEAGPRPASPTARTGADGIEELVFSPVAAGAESFFEVTVGDLGKHWVLEEGTRYLIRLNASPAELRHVDLQPRHGIAAPSAHAVLHMPGVQSLRIGRSHEAQVRLAVTILAPDAHVQGHFDILDGGLYARSLEANPLGLGQHADAHCGPGAWQPGAPVGRTVPGAGLQINHVPFTRSYPDALFGGPLL
jgi:hypothetical protein